MEGICWINPGRHRAKWLPSGQRQVVETRKNGAQVSADQASLTYVTDSEPGIRRLRAGQGFSYRSPDGRTVNRAALARIKSLAIPPAWQQVWICPRPSGHLQAVGTDPAGRREYLYHEEFRRPQETVKHEQVPDVSERVAAVG